MLTKLYDRITQTNEPLPELELRQNISTIRQLIKEEKNKSVLLELLAVTATQPQDSPGISSEIDSCSSPSGVFSRLLQSPDAKTRKNTALLMGDLALNAFRQPLWDSYEKEEQRFVKSAYLTALKNFDCSDLLPQFKEQMTLLTKIKLTPTNQKHVEEEIRALSALLIQEEGAKKHAFTGWKERYNCILLTNRLHRDVTERLVLEGDETNVVKPFSAGVQVLTQDLESLLDIRTYSELLFAIPKMTICPGEPEEAARIIASSPLLSILKKGHKEPAPFFFRIDLKSRMPLDKKSAFSKKMASTLERLTRRELQNSPSDYELELRLVENKKGTFNVLVKLSTIPDTRFSYRKEAVAASIRPVNAALVVELTKDYMAEDAQVLDPFCGVGTMLIERQKIVKGKTAYGIDTYADAIEKAKINTEAAGQIIHYVNRNCLDFTHDYLFDEIFTDMPFITGHKSDEEIFDLYERFFPKARKLLRAGGTIILYSHNRDYVRILAGENNYKILKEFQINDKEDSWVFVMQ